jgi:indolepyruvate decarboxylase
MAFTVADYIIKRLSDQHVDTLFGVPAAYCAPLFDAAGAHGMKAVVTSSDLEAGYAADGYARTRGLGAVSVAYGVGTLSMINAIAGAYVERSPVVVVNGGPTAANLSNLAQLDVVFSHSIGQPDTDLAAYRLVTANAARAAKVADVPAVVDKAISTAITKKRPVYIEINMGIWDSACPMPAGPLPVTSPPAGTESQLAATIVSLIRGAHAPLVLIGTEIQRYDLADKASDLIAKLGVRWATTVLGKSTLAEQGAGFVGVYEGAHSLPAVRTAVENADMLVTLGCVYPLSYASLVQSSFGRMVQIYDGRVRIKTAAKKNAELNALMTALGTAAAKAPPMPLAGVSPPPAAPPPAAGPLTYQQVFERVGAALDNSWLTIPDTFLGIYAAANLPVKGRDAFLCSGVWASIGHSVAAAVGAAFGSGRRPLVLCGDGGFQMTAQALSTMAHYGRKPVVILIANTIYGYEQFLLDPSFFSNPVKPPVPYVALNNWDYVKLANALGFQFATSADTAASLDAALAAAKAFDGPGLIVAQVNAHGLPKELQ